MNDFTKEELEDVHLIYKTFCKDDGTQEQRELTNFEKGILDKLKSMIDKYCEHHEADEFENSDICKHCDKRFR